MRAVAADASNWLSHMRNEQDVTTERMVVNSSRGTGDYRFILKPFQAIGGFQKISEKPFKAVFP